ncbi:MAG: NifB/NifX family molybdenum-iron cluster-binding protein [Candidatus Diapherotrites archaeon]|nr:NifB/NifX family molybdenum-iron cluster-binding protein [Candidatus Diapherotrites archaeon]
MKKAIACVTNSVDSEISEKAARASFILIFEDNELIESIKNPFAVGGGGAGFSMAKLLADKGVNEFIAGASGSNLESALKDKGIKLILKKGKAKEMI